MTFYFLVLTFYTLGNIAKKEILVPLRINKFQVLRVIEPPWITHSSPN